MSRHVSLHTVTPASASRIRVASSPALSLSCRALQVLGCAFTNAAFLLALHPAFPPDIQLPLSASFPLPFLLSLCPSSVPSAVMSYQRAAEATKAGYFAKEIVGVPSKDKKGNTAMVSRAVHCS